MGLFESITSILSESVEPEENIANILMLVVMIVGVVVLVGWFARGGLKSLKDAPVRRNTLPATVAIGVFILYLSLEIMCLLIVGMLSDDWKELVLILLKSANAVVMVVLFVWLAKNFFVRGLKGFGLNYRTIWRDVKNSACNLAAVYPLVYAGLGLVVVVGKMKNGDDWNIETHQMLTTMSDEHISSLLMAAIVVLTVIIAPIFEEMMFRGIIQTAITTSTGTRWVGIFLTSGMFMLVHPPQHRPAIFLLSLGLGYAYERSGSLYRSIFMHMMFNGISVIGTLI